MKKGVLVVGGAAVAAGLGWLFLRGRAEAAPPPPPPPGLANVRVEVIDLDGIPLRDSLLTVAGLECLTNTSGICDFLSLEPGPCLGHCFKEGYEVTEVTLNGAEIPFSDGNF